MQLGLVGVKLVCFKDLNTLVLLSSLGVYSYCSSLSLSQHCILIGFLSCHPLAGRAV